MSLTPEQLGTAMSVFFERTGKSGRPRKGQGDTLMNLAREFGITRGGLRYAIDKELDRLAMEAIRGK